MTIIKKSLRIICIGFSIIGLVGFLGGLMISMNMIPWKSELPLTSCESILIGKNGNIYLALGFYGVIQQYDRKGQFISNWHVDANGGAFHMQRMGNKIKVQIARGDKIKYYNFEGELTRTTDLNEPFRYNNATTGIDPLSKERLILNTTFPVSVSKITNGNEIKIIQTPLIRLVFDSLIPWIITVVGIMGFAFLNDHNYFKRLIVMKN